MLRVAGWRRGGGGAERPQPAGEPAVEVLSHVGGPIGEGMSGVETPEMAPATRGGGAWRPPSGEAVARCRPSSPRRALRVAGV